MKRYIPLVLALGLAVNLGCSSAVAAEVKAPIAAKAVVKAEVKAKIADDKRAAAKKAFGVVLAHMTTVYTSEGQIGGRLQAVIEKQKAAGKNTTELLAKLNDAQRVWLDAGLKLEALQKTVETDIDTMTAKDAKADIHLKVGEIRDAIKKLHQSIEDIIKQAKQVTGAQATTTPAAATTTTQ